MSFTKNVWCFIFSIYFSNFAIGACPNIEEFGAKPGDSSSYLANTVAINKALEENSCAYVPMGAFFISVEGGGIQMPSGSRLKGLNSEKSFLIAADRGNGSVIGRKPPTRKLDYVSGLKIQDLGILLNHAPFHRNNPMMIGIDLAHVSGSIVENVYVGNIPFGEGEKAVANISGWIRSKGDFVQGIGIRICTLGSSESLYSGGERNIIDKVKVWGAQYGISIDDANSCSPNSAAHATSILNSDIQTVTYGIAQQSRHTAGTLIKGNIIQDLVAGGFNSETALFAYVIFGTNSKVENKYIEVVSKNKVNSFFLGPSSRENTFELGYIGYKNLNPNRLDDSVESTITDLGVKNQRR